MKKLKKENQKSRDTLPLLKQTDCEPVGGFRMFCHNLQDERGDGRVQHIAGQTFTI